MKPFMTIRVGAIDVQAFRMPLEDDTFGDFSYINTRIRIDEEDFTIGMLRLGYSIEVVNVVLDSVFEE